MEKAQKTADEFGIPKAYGSYKELLEDQNIQAVYIPLPVSMHKEWSLECARRGIPALCEKPIAANATDARAIVEAFEKNNTLFSEALMYKYHPLTKKVKELTDSGAIGEVKNIRSTFYAPVDNENDIRLRAETGGGSLLDVGCYCVGISRLIAGCEPSKIKGLAEWKIRNKVDWSFTGGMLFPNSIHANFSCGLGKAFDISYEVLGSEGRLLVDRGGMVVWPGEDFTIKLWQGETYNETVIPAANPYQLMVEDFTQALATNGNMFVKTSDTINNMKTIDALLESARKEE